MKYINKISTVFCAAALGLLSFTACEGGDILSINSPDWLSEKVDSIANSNSDSDPIISPTTLGAEDNSTAWWGVHLDNDVEIKSGKKYTTTFTNYTSGASNWNNYVVVLRSKDKAIEYAVLRADDYGWQTTSESPAPSYYTACTHSNTGTTVYGDWATWLAQMNGAKVTLSVTNYGDNTADVVATVKHPDGKQSVQTYSGIGVTASNLYLDFTVDGSRLVFDKELMDVSDVKDYQPASIVLNDVPKSVDLGTSLEDIVSQISATVTYDGGVTKKVAGTDLTVTVVPDLTTTGSKYLVATYDKTYLDATAKSAVSANAPFTVIDKVTKLDVTTQPTTTNYVVYEAGNVVNPLLTEGMEVTATYGDGTVDKIDLSKLTIDPVVAKVGKQDVKISAENGVSTTVSVNVTKVINATEIHPAPSILGTEDCSTGWWGAHLDNDINISKTGTYACSFTNLTSGAGNWNNWVAVLRSADKATEYLVCRADNYGWGTGYNADNASCYNGGDWATWLKAMNGAKVSFYVTNNGNGTADIYAVIRATDGNTYTQSYTGVAVDSSNLYLDFTVDGSCLKFE